MQTAVLLALLMALITASSNILLKKGFTRLNPFPVSFFSVLLSMVFLWLTTFCTGGKNYFSCRAGITVFVVIGIFAPPLVRTLTYYGIHTLGAGRSAPLRALTPFFAVLIAIRMLGESPGPPIFAGIALIIAGTMLITREQGDSANYRKIHLLYPVCAALLAGLAANLRKYGLGIMPHPVFASAVAATSASVCMSVYVLCRKNKYLPELKEFFVHRRESAYIVSAALLTSMGEITDLGSLLYGRVSLVVPIFAVTPLATLLLSRVFLRRHEKITRKIIFSALLIIAGVYIAVLHASR
ncbi:MAG: DMT family transporter [Elusimicrobia bacterium]|nr:DMT family transporter [Elusimicrobiota bacterium]